MNIRYQSSQGSLRDFEVNQTKIKGGCQLGRKAIPHDFKSDLPLGVLDLRDEVMKNSSQFFFILHSVVD